MISKICIWVQRQRLVMWEGKQRAKQHISQLFQQTLTNGAGLTEMFCPQRNIHNHKIKKPQHLLWAFRPGYAWRPWIKKTFLCIFSSDISLLSQRWAQAAMNENDIKLSSCQLVCTKLCNDIQSEMLKFLMVTLWKIDMPLIRSVPRYLKGLKQL